MFTTDSIPVINPTGNDEEYSANNPHHPLPQGKPRAKR